MAGPPAALAAVRVAVRRELADLPPGTVVLTACSGGADSLALAAGLAFVAPRTGLRAGLLTVDHGWDSGSTDRANAVAVQGRTLGLEPVEVLTARTGRSEGEARDARREALERAARTLRSSVVLLGHTLDDQAETVLLGLARGSGARSLAGMARRTGVYRRPLLDLPRSTTRTACEELGLVVWDDPSNADRAFARARVRHEVLPLLERALGPGVAAALARTADLLRADADALDALADRTAATLRSPAGPAAATPADELVGLDVGELAGLPPAVRSRVLRSAMVDAGCPAGALTAGHVASVDALVTAWRGQGAVALPGGLSAVRAGGRIALAASMARGAARGAASGAQ